MTNLWGDTLIHSMEWFNACTFVRIHRDKLTDALSWCVERKGLSTSNPLFYEGSDAWGWRHGSSSDQLIFHFENDPESAMLFKLTWA